ncbi:hypothetical protein QF027_009521 [Streptomyces canus]|nr:hypothetical protein [Streptomyces canus]
MSMTCCGLPISAELRSTKSSRLSKDDRQAGLLEEGQVGFEDRAVRGQGLLGGGGNVGTRSAGPDSDVGRVVAVELPAFAVEADQLGIRLDGVGDVRREERVAVARGQVDRLLAGRAAVPDPHRPLVRPRPHLGVGQRRAETGVGGDLVLAPDLPEELVALGVAVPLVLGRDVEQVALGGAVALADDQVETPARQVVEGGVVLVCPDRVQQAERRDGREQADPLRQGGHMAEYDGR